MKIGVIGAGPAGLCAIKQALSFGCEVIAFEQSDKIGGTWNYTDETDKDKYGLDVHSSMYVGLSTNIPKEIMGYPDYPIETPNGRSFMTAEETLSYLHSYAENFKLQKYVKFEHHVLRVRPLLDKKWEFVVRNLKADKHETFFFDAVFVCNGLGIPYIPKIVGQDIFNGKQVHSHCFRDPRHYANETVLVIGGGPSGVDLTVEIGQFAKKVAWSNHVLEALGKRINVSLSVNTEEKPDVKRLTESGAEFVDGSNENFSVVMYATGYDYKYPFLSIDCGLSTHEKYVTPLYKHCININHPTLAIIGLPYFAVANALFDLQVRFCLTFMSGRKTMPSCDEMLKDTEAEMTERFKQLKRAKAHFLGVERHAQYYEEIASIAGIEPIKPVIIKIFNQSFGKYFENFKTFRNFNYKIIDDENYEVLST